MKPGFFTNDLLAEVEPLGRLLFIGLWTIADREGRLEDRPRKIKAELLPYDDVDAEALLCALASRGFIYRYGNGEANFIQILKFSKHQNPHVKEPASTIPAPDKHQTSTGQDTNEQHSGPADSLLLIPDSLQKHCRAAPDDARQILDFLNSKTGRAYQPVKANLALIRARLDDGFSVEDIRSVVAMKVKQWKGDEKMREYLRPATLFNRTNFAQYQGQLEREE